MDGMISADMQYLIRTATHVIVVIALIVFLLGALTWLGVIRCGLVPGWCDVYYGVVGAPRILIVYGNDGLGNPEALRDFLKDPRHTGANVQVKHLNYISEENLKEYQLVIVEKARTMSTKKMQDFLRYADAGGKLVWVADSGTVLGPGDQYLYRDEIYADANHEMLGPWARKTEDGKVVNLQNYISVAFQGNYCDLMVCDLEEEQITGKLVPTSTNHRLVYGMTPNLPFRGNFTVVGEVEGVGTKLVLSIDTDQPIQTEEGTLGQTVPVIVASGLGEKIVYYAFPPEQLYSKMQYATLLENLYYGMFE